MKPKAALVKDGFLPAGSENKRGRMSAAGIARCEELVSQGWKIEGFAAASSKPSDESADAKPAVTRVKTDPNRLVDVPDMRRDERDWSAHVTVDGKSQEIGFRTVDNSCGSSLGWCYCPESRVWLNNVERVVTFKARKGAG